MSRFSITKIVLMGIFYVVSSAVALTKSNALNFMERSLKQTFGKYKYMNYHCQGDSVVAACMFQPIGNEELQINNLVLETTFLGEDKALQKISGTFQSSWISRTNLFQILPGTSSFACEMSRSLHNESLDFIDHCTIKTARATIIVQAKYFITSPAYRYGGVDVAMSHYEKDFDNVLNRLEILNNTSEYEEKIDEYSLVNDLQKQQKVFNDLRQYNFGIKEIRIDIRTSKLAESVFDVFSRGYYDPHSFNFDDSAHKNTGLSQLYYAQLESLIAAIIRDIAENPSLSNELKKNLYKIVTDTGKMFDIYSHKRSIKLLIRPINSRPINIGEKFFMFRDLLEDNYRDKYLYNFINEYDIRLVPTWE
ncbi:hypothetical protein CQA66_00285 [Helicobacter aurati]|uniref:Uncharacterized protein n=1 Tax=Helicobacter aurati TaxID=137778 RepID=A0A3D8J8B4_9HELI|nr:hypothetical protein [Helicobacter aurati]RDU73668.1 hypothetical protein CQA66_00285 [Helicobacter aurati]